MREKLKQQPFVCLALAIAAGIVLGGVALKTFNFVSDEYFGDPLTSVTILIALLTLAGIVYRTRRLSIRRQQIAREQRTVFAKPSFRSRHAHAFDVARALLMVFVIVPLAGIAIQLVVSAFKR